MNNFRIEFSIILQEIKIQSQCKEVYSVIKIIIKKKKTFFKWFNFIKLQIKHFLLSGYCRIERNLENVRKVHVILGKQIEKSCRNNTISLMRCDYALML